MNEVSRNRRTQDILNRARDRLHERQPRTVENQNAKGPASKVLLIGHFAITRDQPSVPQLISLPDETTIVQAPPFVGEHVDRTFIRGQKARYIGGDSLVDNGIRHAAALNLFAASRMAASALSLPTAG